jgi:hypothetical protein
VSPDFTETFARSEKKAFDGQPLRLTDAGIWLAMPLDVLGAAFEKLHATGFWARLGERGKVLDAGMGDGRVVAALCNVGHDLWAYGIESHPRLWELAENNLRTLTERGMASSWRICQGDYLDVSTYPKLGVRLEDIDAFFNYPDGNEHELAALLSVHGRAGAILVVVTAEHGIELEGLTLEDELTIDRGPGVPEFRLVLYRVDRRAGDSGSRMP